MLAHVCRCSYLFTNVCIYVWLQQLLTTRMAVFSIVMNTREDDYC